MPLVTALYAWLTMVPTIALVPDTKSPAWLLAPPVTMLVTVGIWAGGPSGQAAKLGISSRARGKVPTAQAE